MTDTTPAFDSITDPETLAARPNVTRHEQTATVDAETLETLVEVDDLAPVGVTNGDGEVLVARITDTCAWKIPSAAVAPEEAYGETAREWVQRNAGIDIELTGVEAVWRLEAELEDGTRSASRYFVVFSGIPTDGATDLGGEAVEAKWVDALPPDAEEVPGSDLFFQ